jgi:spore germination cell wall hydrolase CwlJ-like protein
MRSSHNLIKLAIITGVCLVSLIDHNYFQQLKTTEVKVEEPIVVAKEVDKNQLQCLADNIFYEAGSEPIEGKAAVARVVLNRVNHGFAPTPCKVVYQTTTVKRTNDFDEIFWIKVCQFSWVCEGKGNPNRNSQHYQSSLQVAKDVLIYDKYKEVIPKTVLFFHNTSIHNPWPHEVVARIGNHIFYQKKHGKHSKKPRERHVQSQQLSGETDRES